MKLYPVVWLIAFYSTLKSCPSILYGANYTTSEVEIFNDKIISWDRGFDINNNQVWGATNGGYIFNKIKD